MSTATTNLNEVIAELGKARELVKDLDRLYKSITDKTKDRDWWSSPISGFMWFCLTPHSLFAYAFALSTLWGWFVVPFADAPPLSIPMAGGLSVVVSFLRIRFDGKKLTNEQMVMVHFYPWFALLVGWIWTLFM